MEDLALLQDELSYRERERQTIYDAETLLSELVNGNMRTEFKLKFTGNDLVGEDNRSLIGVTNRSLEDVYEVTKDNPVLIDCEPRRRKLESEEIFEGVEMGRGNRPNTMIVVSDLPPELANITRDVGGYNATRKQTMLRVLMRQQDGNLKMISQSLDGSNRTALEKIYATFGIIPKQGELLGQRIQIDLDPSDQLGLVDNLVDVYDSSLADQHGGEWYAGRRPADLRNTYDFVRSQTDLIDMFVDLELNNELTPYMMYDIAATMQKRFESAKRGLVSINSIPETISPQQLRHEIFMAGYEARVEGKTFSACGATLDANGVKDSTENNLEQSGMGNKEDLGDCEFMSKECPLCNKKNVKTTVKVDKNTGEKKIEGKCGCVKIYSAQLALAAYSAEA